MDNWYTSLPLLSELRKLNIGGCGTCTTNSPNYPSSLNVVKTIKMAYQQRSGNVEDGVATLLWMDNGPVKMMTTIHPLTGEGASVLKSKKRPGLKAPMPLELSNQDYSKMVNGRQKYQFHRVLMHIAATWVVWILLINYEHLTLHI